MDYSRGHCGVDLGNNPDIRKRLDFEGVAIDRTIWSPDNMQAYIVYEGSSEDEPLLFKIRYTYDSSVGSCSVAVGDTVSLFHALPCLPGSNGIESLTWKETNRNGVATFFVGVQDTGKVYEVTSEGKSNGGRCYDRGLGMTDLSASSYDGKYLWSFYGERGELTVIDPSRENCQLPVYDVFSPTWDKEGIVIDFQRGNMYVAVDEGEDDPSFVAVYNFTYPTNLEDDIVCVGKKRYQTCSGYLNCSDTYYPTWSPTSFPTYILQG